jgi:hypothetical protein
VWRGEGAQAALELRGARFGVEARLQRSVWRRRGLLWRLLRLRSLTNPDFRNGDPRSVVDAHRAAGFGLSF